MVDKTPHEAMPGSASGLDGYEILLLARTSPPSVNSITENNFFGPNNDQASRGDHGHLIADSTRPGFMSTGDRAKLDALATNRQIPAGGATGQIMQKVNSTDYNIAWADPPVGGGGGGWAQQNTQSALTASNPVMALGGMGWETDTGRWKVGDGVTAWNSLAYQDMARTPATITNPGTTATFRFRTYATQIVVFSTPPAGTLTIQAPTSAPPASHEGEMYLRIVNNSGSTITVSAAAFQLDGDYLVSSIPTATTQEYTIWVLAGVWYISGGQDIPDASIGNAQLADIPYGRIKGRYTAGTGAVEDLVPNQVRWLTDNAQPNILAISANTTLTKAAHQGRYLVCSAAVNLTVDASTDFDQYYDVTISAVGGAVTVVATATVNAPAGLVIPQGSLGFLRRTTAPDVYSLDVFGHPKVATANSISGTLSAGTNTLQLSGDAASPGNSKYYGTNAGGSKGFYDLPAGGGGASNLAGLTDVVDTLSPSEDQVLVFTSGLWRAATIATAGGSGAFVDNIAALTAIASPTDKQFVYVRGYTTAGDGGGGWFMWHAGSSDTKMCTGATVAAGGTGYAVGDLLRPVGGTTWNVEDEIILRVATLSGSAVATLTVVYPGHYSVAPTTSGCATVEFANGSGCTVNLTIVSKTDYGTSFPKDGGGAGRWYRKYEGKANIMWFGATGNGVTNDTLAVQRAVWSVIPLYVPPGTYVLTSAITWFCGRVLNMQGEGFYGWARSLFADGRAAGTEEALFHKFGMWMKADGTYSFETGYEVGGTNLGGVGQGVTLRNIGISSRSSIYGSCLELTLTDDVLLDTCEFDASFRGVTLGQACFDNTIISCRFTSNFMANFPWSGSTGGTSNKIIAKRAWGIYTAGHSFILGVAVVGYGTAIRMAGSGPTLRGARIEVNNYGLIMSNQEYSIGQIDSSTITRCTVDGFTMEANTIGIVVDSLNSSSITNFGIQGSPELNERPAGEIGIIVNNSSYNAEISKFWCNGTFSTGSVINLSRFPLWSHTAYAESGLHYCGTNSIFGEVGTNIPQFHCIRTGTSEGSLTAFSDLKIRGLDGLNIRDGYVRSMNFGDRVYPSTSATTATVTFPTAIGGSLIAFNSITTPADGASTLAAGTYYYATTVVGKTGESGITYWDATQHAYRTVVLGTTGLAVSFTFYGGSTSWLKRRIYRGSTQGAFQGYWEITMGDNFYDNGTTAFTRGGWPPVDGALQACEEPNTNYEIALSPSWGTTAWVSNKATTGFTINFGTAAPASQSCGWLLYRP